MGGTALAFRKIAFDFHKTQRYYKDGCHPQEEQFSFLPGFLATDSSVVVSVAFSLPVLSTSEFMEQHGHILPTAGGLIG